jgi:kynurenine formamidase
VRTLLPLGLPLVALASLVGCRDAPARASGGFWFPDEGRVIDLTRPASAPGDPRATTITTALEPGGASVDRIEPGRCVAPILVIDVRERALQAPDFAFGSEDVLEHERRWGAIPAGSLVVLLTGGAQRDVKAPSAAARPLHPGFATAVVEMLARQRGVVGFGTDAPALDASRAAAPASEAARAALAAGCFVLTNLARLDQLPDGRAILLLAPPLERLPSAPARVLALVERRVGRGTR